MRYASTRIACSCASIIRLMSSPCLSPLALVHSAIIAVFAFTATASAAAEMAEPDCNQPARDPLVFFQLSGHPFEPIPTGDGCYVFVSLPSHDRGLPSRIAVIRRSAGEFSTIREIPVKGSPTGMVLSHDGKVLVAATGNVAFLDAERLISGHGEPVLGYLNTGSGAGTVYANLTDDDKYLFVSNEDKASITVVNFEKARHNGFRQDSIIGVTPVGPAPIALSFSPDGKVLYTTIEGARPQDNWPATCKPEVLDAPHLHNAPPGAVIAIDVEKATQDPAHAEIARTPAGCSPVRLALSSAGDRAYVTARASDAVLVIDTRKLLQHAADPVIASIPVGSSPVGIWLSENGSRLVATNSNRFASTRNQKQSLSVVDTANITAGNKAVIGTIAAGSFPREIRASADSRTLFVTNFLSDTLEIIDLARLSKSMQ